MKRSQIAGAVLAIAVLVGMHFVPESIGLSTAGIHTLGVLIAIIIALVTEPLPLGVTCMLGIPLLVIFGCAENITQALVGYTNHIWFFVLVGFGISEAVSKVPLSKRLLVLLIKIFGYKTKNILLAVMLCSAVLSSLMSNVATTAVLLSVVMNFLTVYEDEAVRRQSGKAFMIGLPIAAQIGGMMTPAGSAMNLLGIDYLAEVGITVTFVQWMAIGIPVAMISLIFAWLITAKVFKPAELSKESVENYIKSLNIPDKFSFEEKYVSVVLIGLFVFWVLSSWFPAFQITVVGTIGFVLLFLPKIAVLEWKSFSSNVSWASITLIGTFMGIGTLLSTHGVSEWLVNLFFKNLTISSPALAVFFIAIIVFVLLLPIPIGPALISMLGMPLTALATTWGLSPTLTIFPLICCAGCCFILPLDTVPLLTYSTGYYKMSDMPKVSVAIQLFIAVICALWMPVCLGMLGF